MNLIIFSRWLVFAQQEPAAPGIFPMWAMIALLVGIFYLMVLRPEKQRQKAHQQLLEKLKKHDRVVTIAGIKGLVVQVNSEFVTLRIDEKNNVDIEITRSSIARVLTEENEKEQG